MNRKLFKLKAAGLVVLGLFLMVGVTTLTFAFTNGKGELRSPVTTYYNTGNGVYVPTPPLPENLCILGDDYPCTIELENEIDADVYPELIFQGPGGLNNVPVEAGIITPGTPESYSPY